MFVRLTDIVRPFLRGTSLCCSLAALVGGRFALVRPLDVFRIQPGGGVRWIGTVEDMEAARALVKTEATKGSGDFLVVNIETGDRTEIKVDPAA